MAKAKKKKGKASKVLGLLLEPSEFVAAVRLKLGALGARPIPAPAGSSAELCADVAFCDELLGKVSRSFSAVIRQLPDEVCLPVCVFYLVLRALDTVEDETELSKFDKVIARAGKGTEATESLQEQRQEAQRSALRSFHALHPATPPGPLPDLEGLVLGDVGKGDEARLLKEYQRVINVFRCLPEIQQEVIADICLKMGVGMASYVGRDMGAGTEDLDDYNNYCHIVAGLVGEGLTRQFHASGLERLEKPGTAGKKLLEQGIGTIASDMGLFLQKVNIIRDYLEDFTDGRSWWPRSVWSKHASALGDLAKPENGEAALACLNELIADALELAPRCISYLKCLENGGVFSFCAIPQVMAIMTLTEIFDNYALYLGVVKIRKPMAARILLTSRDMAGISFWYKRASTELKAKIAASGQAKSEVNVRLAKAIERLITALDTP